MEKNVSSLFSLISAYALFFSGLFLCDPFVRIFLLEGTILVDCNKQQVINERKQTWCMAGADANY